MDVWTTLVRNSTLFLKLFRPSVRRKMSSNRENFWNLRLKANFLRPLEQFFERWKVNKISKQNFFYLFLKVSQIWRIIIQIGKNNLDLETYMKSLKRYALKLIDTYLPISSTAWPKKRFAICYFFIVMPSLLWFNRWILTFSFNSVTTVVELERTQCKFHRGVSHLRGFHYPGSHYRVFRLMYICMYIHASGGFLG